MFNVEVLDNKTIIDDQEGFTILSIDDPAEELPFLDKPPLLKEVK